MKWVTAKSLEKILFFKFKVSYAIGIAHPLSITVISYGTSPLTEPELLKIVNDNFDLRPGVLIKYVGLDFYFKQEPFYLHIIITY
jgi:S-adenosylmethionine synthetase